jgi:hypothetical protein
MDELVVKLLLASSIRWLPLCKKQHRPIVIALVIIAVVLLALIHKF